MHFVVTLGEHSFNRGFVQDLLHLGVARVNMLVVVLAFGGLGLGLGRAHPQVSPRRRSVARARSVVARRRRL